MKRLSSNFTISKLGHSAYNAFRMSSPVNEDEKRILHFSYNLALDAEQEEYLRSVDEDGYGELTRRDSTVRSHRALSQEGKNPPEEDIQRKDSLRYLFNNEARNSMAARPRARRELIFYGGAMQGYVHEKPNSTDILKSKGNAVYTVKKNNSLVTYHRKCGLGEATNVSLMRHKLRKKAVCDSTDNSHYQRQFLRVLNKRF